MWPTREEREEYYRFLDELYYREEETRKATRQDRIREFKRPSRTHPQAKQVRHQMAKRR